MRFRVWFQAVKVRFGGVPNTVEKVVRGQAVAYVVERTTRETQAEQYWDTVLDSIEQENVLFSGRSCLLS